MHIFIDESGSFVRNSTNSNSVSTIGTLTVPDRSIDGLNKLYGRLRNRLPKEKGEVKGRLLNEEQVVHVCRILKKTGCIFNVIATDMKFQSDADIDNHKAIQAAKLTENITDEHLPSVVEGVEKLQAQLMALSSQLYIQSVGLTEIIYDTIQKTSMYFSLRWPKELQEYNWVIDGKGKSGTTNWEKMWSILVLPSLESKARIKPFICADFGDYSAQDRFLSTPSEYKSRVLNLPSDGEFLDIRKLMMENFRFSSEPEYGLEVVDILTNTIRRSMMRNFKREGWMHIRSLMIHYDTPQYIKLFTLGEAIDDLSKTPYIDLLRDFNSGGKSMLRPKDYRD